MCGSMALFLLAVLLCAAYAQDCARQCYGSGDGYACSFPYTARVVSSSCSELGAGCCLNKNFGICDMVFGSCYDCCIVPTHVHLPHGHSPHGHSPYAPQSHTHVPSTPAERCVPTGGCNYLLSCPGFPYECNNDGYCYNVDCATLDGLLWWHYMLIIGGTLLFLSIIGQILRCLFCPKDQPGSEPTEVPQIALVETTGRK